jgi:hypothetical protein
VHEIEDDEHELDGGEQREGGEDEPVGQGQVDQHDLQARDDAEDHGDLDVNMQLAGFGVGRGGGGGGGGHGQG